MFCCNAFVKMFYWNATLASDISRAAAYFDDKHFMTFREKLMVVAMGFPLFKSGAEGTMVSLVMLHSIFILNHTLYCLAVFWSEKDLPTFFEVVKFSRMICQKMQHVPPVLLVTSLPTIFGTLRYIGV